MKDKTRRVLGFLGLVEDEYGEYGQAPAPRPFSDQSNDDAEWASAPAPARTFPTTSARQSGSSFPTAPLAPARQSNPISILDSNNAPRARQLPSSGPARGISSFSQERDVAFFSPLSYNESRRVTDLLRSNRAVVMNVSALDADRRRRLVDFAAGTVYALNARIEPLTPTIYLISPQGVHLGPDAKERLAQNNYANPDA